MLYYLTTAFEGWVGNSVYWVIQIFTQFHFRAFAALIFSFLFVILLGPHTIARLRAPRIVSSSPIGWSGTPDGTSMPVMVAFQPARVSTDSTAAIFTRFLLPMATVWIERIGAR